MTKDDIRRLAEYTLQNEWDNYFEMISEGMPPDDENLNMYDLLEEFGFGISDGEWEECDAIWGVADKNPQDFACKYGGDHVYAIAARVIRDLEGMDA